MTDSEAFADLVQLKRQFYDLNEAHALWCTTLPPALELTEEQRTRMRDAQVALTDLGMRIHGHAAFEGLNQMQRFELDQEASKQARADGD